MTYFSRLLGDIDPIRVGVLGFDGVASLDLTGPLETLARAHVQDDGNHPRPCYEVVLLGTDGKTFTSESGVVFKAQRTIRSHPELDTIIVPGGSGLLGPMERQNISTWLVAQAGRTRRIAAVCSGIYPLAETGFLDGRQVATHWRCTADVARRFPKLQVNCTASFVKDGGFYTCGGGMAGVEMALALVNEDYGAQVALSLAREFVARLRPPGLECDSHDPSAYQADPMDRLAELPEWILGHIEGDLSVEVLAKRACLCPRHFSRLFKSIFKQTPANFVEHVRLSEAGRRLQMSHHSIASIGAAVGYANTDSFRRAFERRFGIRPTDFRRRPFSPANGTPPNGKLKMSKILLNGDNRSAGSNSKTRRTGVAVVERDET